MREHFRIGIGTDRSSTNPRLIRTAVSERVKGWALIVVMTTLFAGPSFAAAAASILKGLTAVIALQGVPCGQVVSVVRQGDSDYIAPCEDGNRYQVSVTSQGRVVVQKQ